FAPSPALVFSQPAPFDSTRPLSKSVRARREVGRGRGDTQAGRCILQTGARGYDCQPSDGGRRALGPALINTGLQTVILRCRGKRAVVTAWHRDRGPLGAAACVISMRKPLKTD